MRNMIIIWIAALAAVLGFSRAAPAQKLNLELGKEPGLEVPEVTAGPGWKTCVRCQNKEHVKAARDKYKVQGHAFDPHDVTGVWDNDPGSPGNGGIYLDFKTLPEMTAYGKQLWEATQAVQIHPEKPAMNGGEGSKDPMLHCDPLGYPRSFTYNYGFEFVRLPDRVVQFFEWGNSHRMIWTDGRKLPEDPPEPRWYGYAVGRWEGDTFIVESNGYEDRSWLDQDRRTLQRGIPHSDQMRIVERWKRTSYETLEVELTIIDPKVFTAPWTTRGKNQLRPGAEMSEYYCVPSDSEQYNRELTGGKHEDAPAEKKLTRGKTNWDVFPSSRGGESSASVPTLGGLDEITANIRRWHSSFRSIIPDTPFPEWCCLCAP
jgi:hypothetical protein